MRVRISQACILLGLVAGGFWLQYGKRSNFELWAFALLFLVAAICRFTSAGFLATQSEPQHEVKERHVSMWQVFAGKRNSASSRLLFYLFAVQGSAFIAGPYFAPFMLSHLEMKEKYYQYAILIGISFIGKVLALPLWGRVAQYAGPRRLLWIGGISIIPVAAAWMISRDFWYLSGLQLVAGITWAAYELAFFLMFFEAIPREERTSILTVYNFGNSAAQVAGAFVGAIFLWQFGKTYDAYLWLFGLSSLARLLTIVLLVRIPVIHLPKNLGTPVLRTMAVSSGDEGSLDQPILTSLPDDEAAEEEPQASQKV